MAWSQGGRGQKQEGMYDLVTGWPLPSLVQMGLKLLVLSL